MNLFIFTSFEDDSSKRLMDVAINCENVETKEFFYSFERLMSRLNKPNFEETILVMHLSDRKQLSWALSIKELLHDMRLILILPDRQAQTISKGHKLFPRFVSYADSDFLVVGAVLKKMIENNRHGERILLDQSDRMKEEEPEGCLS